MGLKEILQNGQRKKAPRTPLHTLQQAVHETRKYLCDNPWSKVYSDGGAPLWKTKTNKRNPNVLAKSCLPLWWKVQGPYCLLLELSWECYAHTRASSGCLTVQVPCLDIFFSLQSVQCCPLKTGRYAFSLQVEQDAMSRALQVDSTENREIGPKKTFLWHPSSNFKSNLIWHSIPYSPRWDLTVLNTTHFLSLLALVTALSLQNPSRVKQAKCLP